MVAIEGGVTLKTGGWIVKVVSGMGSLPVNFLISSSMDKGGGRVRGADFEPSSDGNSKDGKVKLRKVSETAGIEVDVAETRITSSEEDCSTKMFVCFVSRSGFWSCVSENSDDSALLSDESN